DRDETRHDADERSGGADTELGPQAPAKPVAAEKRLEVEPERQHADALGRSDPEPEDLAPHLLAHREDPVRHAGEAALDGEERPGPGGREIALQHVAVVGVHDHGKTGEPRGDATDGARLRGVGVHDVGTEPRHEPAKTEDRRDIAGRMDLSPELRDDMETLDPPAVKR